MQALGASTAGNAVNQDAFAIHREESRVVVALADGHGPSGARAAQVAVAEAVAFCKQLSTDPSDEQLEDLFTKLDLRVQMQARSLLHESGTTLTLLLCERAFAPLHEGGFQWTHEESLVPDPSLATDSCGDLRPYCRVTVANVGDTQAHSVRLRKVLSAKHSLLNLEEYRRVQREKQTQEARCVYACSGGLSQALYDEAERLLPPPVGQLPCNVSGDYATYVRFGDTALNMTRVLGDASSRAAGVCSRPEVRRFRLPHDDLLLLATDGVWDCFHAPELYDLALRELGSAEPEAATSPFASRLTQPKVDALLGHVVRRASSLFGTQGRDDCTLVVVRAG